jgi:hypothetical protein
MVKVRKPATDQKQTVMKCAPRDFISVTIRFAKLFNDVFCNHEEISFSFSEYDIHFRVSDCSGNPFGNKMVISSAPKDCNGKRGSVSENFWREERKEKIYRDGKPYTKMTECL